jgi:hypothetical protein
VAPQAIPPTSEETEPEPEPVFETVSVYTAVKLAVTERAALIVTKQVPVPEQPAPDQPVNREPPAALAVSVTVVPAA